MNALLSDWTWIVRRVESVQLLDARVTKRHVTVDVDTNAITDPHRLGGGEVIEELLAAGILSGERLPVPVAVLGKDLLMDFDIRDANEQALVIPSREEDSYAGASVVAYVLRRFLSKRALEEVGPWLFEVAYSFPLDGDEARRFALTIPPSWSDATRQEWNANVRRNERARLVLEDFAAGFLLLAQVPPDDGTHLVKFSYQGHVKWNPGPLSRLGLIASKADIVTPGVIQTRSYHLRFAAPEGLVITGSLLRQTVSQRSAPETVLLKTNLTEVYLYATRLFPQPKFDAVFKLRAPTNGFIRTAAASTILTALTLLFVHEHFTEFKTLSHLQGDALVTLLLVVPLLLGAYVVRPREHTMVNTLLRRTRLLVAGAALLPYLVAMVLLPELRAWPVRLIVRQAALSASSVAALLVAVSALTSLAIYLARRKAGKTRRTTVLQVVAGERVGPRRALWRKRGDG